MLKKNKTLKLKISILLARLKKPIVPKKIISLKKLKKLRLMGVDDSYNHYRYVKEYEFSPSNTLKPRKGRIIANIRKFYLDVLSISKCLDIGTETLSNEHYFSSCEEEYCSVDERAERFIQRFYEEMRKQRRQDFHLLEM